jgi:hypothetical protein
VRPLGCAALVSILADVRVLVAVHVRGDPVLMLRVRVVSRRVDVPGQRRRPESDQRTQQQSRNGSVHVASLHASRSTAATGETGDAGSLSDVGLPLVAVSAERWNDSQRSRGSCRHADASACRRLPQAPIAS